MSLEITLNSNENYKVIKQHFLNRDELNVSHWLFDAGKITTYYFNCYSCKSFEIEVSYGNFLDYRMFKNNLSEEEMIELGGIGMFFKIMKCENCGCIYYISFGYFEPNNGRDEYLVHSIIEIENKI